MTHESPPPCRRPESSRHRRRVASLLAATVVAAGCSGKPAGPGGGPPAMPVEVVTLAERPVERTSEFIASVKSRRSTRVRPEVEGSVTRILVRSGDTVEPGRTLLVIDHRMQEALVARLEAELLARRADLQQARQEAARTETLVEAGAASQAELEQATTTLQTGEAQLNATEAQLREQRVALSYHTVTAPTAGIVGDIPVRVGDRVTKSTLLTTIDQASGLELYINVPVQEAPSLRLGLPVHLLDDDGSILATEKLSFISPSVEGDTQSVLAKATLVGAVGLRTEQFIRVRVVWSEAPALVAPVIALDRIGGQHFAYLAEEGEGGVTVARQRVVEPGGVVGNDYVIRSGLAPGDRLIVSGLQRIGDGAPVTIVPAKAEAPEAVPASRGGGD